MKSLSSKRMVRIEKKKKKMDALLEISKLNEQDRQKINNHKTVIVLDNAVRETEPKPKRPRTENQIQENEIPVENNHRVEAPTQKPLLQGEEYLELKRMLNEKRKRMRSEPLFRLREVGNNASLSVASEERIPIFLSDVQHLILYSQIGHHSPYNPARWCQLDKFSKLQQATVFVVENVALHHYLNHKDCFPFLTAAFEFKVEMITPEAYKGDVVQDLVTVPLTSTQMKNYVNKFGSLEQAVTLSTDVFDKFRNFFPVKGEQGGPDPAKSVPDKFPRTHLLLSGWQMVEENFPLPIQGLMETKYAGYVLTKDSYAHVTPNSPMFGLDCEMCRTTIGDLELTRISVVDEDHRVFYEQLVKPDNKIVDYLTQFSGITPKMMKNVTKRLADVQEDLRKLLPPDAILVGQSLSNDMHAIKMMHPYIIDTSVIFNITGERARKTKLQTLAREFLSETIQESRKGHCSIEDSLASLKLAKHKLKHDLYYGDAVMADLAAHVRHHPELGHPHFATSLLKQTTKLDKTALVIGLEDIASKYTYYTSKGQADKRITVLSDKTNKSAVTKACSHTGTHSLRIVHARLSPPAPAPAKDAPKALKNVDKWARQLHETSATPGLVVVLFGGRSDLGNGCCFITMKKSS